MNYENIEKVKRIDFDRLDTLISERLAALKMLAGSLDKLDVGPEVADAICRDTILPCVYTLAQFLESVEVDVVGGSNELRPN